VKPSLSRGIHKTMALLRKVMVSVAVVLNAALAVWWIWQAARFAVLEQRRLFDGGVQYAAGAVHPANIPTFNPSQIAVQWTIYAIPPLMAIIALPVKRHRSIVVTAIVLNLLAALWWVRLYLRVHLTLLAMFSIAPAVGALALLLNLKRWSRVSVLP